MVTQQRHSATIDALIDVSERLTAASFPPNETTGRVPLSGTANDKTGTYDEWVDVEVRIEDTGTSTEWARIGNGAVGRRDERFFVDIYISSTVAGKTRTAALERIRQLTQVVEDLFHDPDTGALIPVGVGAAWSSMLGGIRQVVPQAFRTDQGWTAACTVSVAVAARI